MTTRRAFVWGAAGLGAASFGATVLPYGNGTPAFAETFPVIKTEAEWRKKLTSAQFTVLRQEGTERPYTSKLLEEHRPGKFACAGCDQAVFASETKFDSGTGWPSFWAPIDKSVSELADTSFGMTRTAVRCGQCGGHLGHVFNDGPKPTGLRYCMNGVAMGFKPTTA